MAFCGNMQDYAAVGQMREFCKSHDGHEKFTTLVIVSRRCNCLPSPDTFVSWISN